MKNPLIITNVIKNTHSNITRWIIKADSKKHSGRSYNIDVYINTDNSGGVVFNGVEHCGLWFDENNSLKDYDGIYDLRAWIIQCIRVTGYHVPRYFEPETPVNK